MALLKKTVTRSGVKEVTHYPASKEVVQGEVRYYINPNVYVPESVIGRDSIHSSDKGRTTSRWEII